jgi:hypothetical protein
MPRRPKTQATPPSPATPTPDETPKTRRRGRAPGAPKKSPIAAEAARELLDAGSVTAGAMKMPKDILLESANYFWNRAQFLSAHAKALARASANAEAIDRIMTEADNQLMLSCKVSEMCAPYYHARVSGPLTDGAGVQFVARLPSPCKTMEEWGAEYRQEAAGPEPERWTDTYQRKPKGSH